MATTLLEEMRAATVQCLRHCISAVCFVVELPNWDCGHACGGHSPTLYWLASYTACMCYFSAFLQSGDSFDMNLMHLSTHVLDLRRTALGPPGRQVAVWYLLCLSIGTGILMSTEDEPCHYPCWWGEDEQQ